MEFPKVVDVSDTRVKPVSISLPPLPPAQTMVPHIDSKGSFYHPNDYLDKLIRYGQFPSGYPVNFHVDTLKHHKETTVGILYVTFINSESVKNFQIDYNIIVGNLPDKIEGKLNVIID